VMKTIFYSSIIDERSKEICAKLETLGYNISLKLHHSKITLESKLREPLHGIALMILYIYGESDLLKMIGLQELIIGIPLILIMRDTSGETMKKAHLLRPRFIFGADENLEHMCLVFEKMLTMQSNYGHKQGGIYAP